MIFTPVPKATENNVDIVEGEVLEVFEPCCNDVFFKLKDHERRYYVNRGLERGFSIPELNKELKEQTIQLKVIQHWTPLDWNKSIGSIAEIKQGDDVLFPVIQ